VEGERSEQVLTLPEQGGVEKREKSMFIHPNALPDFTFSPK
jgi:hypothetical protein